MFKRGLKLWSTNTDTYFDEAKRLYNESLFDYIELFVVPNSLPTLSKWQQLDIPYIIHHAHFMQGFNLAKKEMEASNLKIYQETKKFADALNAKYIIFHGGIDGDIKETARQLKSFNEPRAIIENKPMLALPNKMGGKHCRGYNTSEIQYVMEETGCAFCLDFGHAVCAANALNQEPYSYIEDLIKLKPVMFHLTDLADITSPYDSHLHLGEGQLDIKKVLSLVPVDSFITFETKKNSQASLDDFKQDMIWLQNLNLQKEMKTK